MMILLGCPRTEVEDVGGGEATQAFPLRYLLIPSFHCPKIFDDFLIYLQLSLSMLLTPNQRNIEALYIYGGAWLFDPCRSLLSAYVCKMSDGDGGINSDTISQSSSSRTEWTWLENKHFEMALAMFPDDAPDRWANICSRLPGRTLLEVLDHYHALVRDIKLIESGDFETPSNHDEDSAM
ncbi:Transcription factor RADIALIS [Ananas comosus]|uniref:Transcription factor RADIALIS n=1 Tax=Ananas comosus TaxID=4615 RepID=A0A199VYU3_ANACO|nr:Transcription factor RADIALIS [Ananas comosus]